MFTISGLTHHIQGRALFEKASATLHKGDKVGFVGRNGVGKTTLLKIISGEIHSEPGEIVIPEKARVGKVRQDPPSGEVSLIDSVLSSDEHLTGLLKEAENTRDPARLIQAHEELNVIKAYGARARAAKILAGLGFGEQAQQQSCSSLSGGWKMRVALASLLFVEPDLLLLDEPTNHLDLEATLWLESYLKNYSGTLFLVSHDRSLLNRVANKIVHLENLKLYSYTGNYDQFEQNRSEKVVHQVALKAKQTAQMAQMQAFVERFRAKASKARQAQSRLKALEKMKPVVSFMEEKSVSFNLPSPEELPSPLVSLDKVSIGYDKEQPILRNVSMRLDQEDRIALLGANGNGKSTLMKLLSGRLLPLAGEVSCSQKLRVGYFSQDQADELDLESTPYALMAAMMPKGTLPEKVRAQLGRFSFGENHFDRPVKRLSGGEKSRLLFALMSRESPHILMLDEPTNHLDMESRQSLIRAINNFKGAIVIVSHDPQLIEFTADRLLLVADGTVQSFDGNLEDYRNILIEQCRKEGSEQSREKNDSGLGQGGPNINKKYKRKAAAETRAVLAPLRKALQRNEAQITKLSREKEKLQEALARPELYNSSSDKLRALTKDLGIITKKLEGLEEEWLLQQEELEESMQDLF